MTAAICLNAINAAMTTPTLGQATALRLSRALFVMASVAPGFDMHRAVIKFAMRMRAICY